MREQMDDLKSQLSLEESLTEALSEISMNIVASESVDYLTVLKILGEAVGVGRAYIYLVDDAGYFSKRSIWTSSVLQNSLERFSKKELPLLINWLERNEPVILSDIEKMPQEAVAEKRVLKGLGVRAILIIPIYVGGDLTGFVGLSEMEGPRSWHPRVVRILRVIGDIIYSTNQKKRAEQKLNRLGAVVDQVVESIIITDKAGNIEYVNPAFEKMSGYKLHEVVGASPRILKSNEHPSSHYESMSKAMREGSVWKGRFINRKKDGSFYEVENVVMPIRDKSGEIANFAALQRDVTEQVKIENRLRQSQKMEAVGTLASGIAHEINTPMQFIMDNTIFLDKSFEKILKYLEFIDGVDDGKMDPESYSELRNKSLEYKIDFLQSEIPYSIGDTLDGIERVRKIVMAMKDFAHPADKEKSYHDLNKAIESTTVITRNVWKYNSELIVNLERELPPVFCSIDDINQIVLNLIVNAADAISEKKSMLEATGVENVGKGTISVKTMMSEESVIIEVSDSGTGIPQAVKEKIFEPFFTTKPVGKGTGQGLAIAHDLVVNKHNGSIDVTSVPGEGTTFAISIPVDCRDQCSGDIEGRA